MAASQIKEQYFVVVTDHEGGVLMSTGEFVPVSSAYVFYVMQRGQQIPMQEFVNRCDPAMQAQINAADRHSAGVFNSRYSWVKN